MQPAFPAKVLPLPSQSDGRFFGVSTNPPATLLSRLRRGITPKRQRPQDKPAETRAEYRATPLLPPLCVLHSMPGEHRPHTAHSIPPKTQAGWYDCHRIGAPSRNVPVHRCRADPYTGRTTAPKHGIFPAREFPYAAHFPCKAYSSPRQGCAPCAKRGTLSHVRRMCHAKKRKLPPRASVTRGGSFVRPMRTAQTTSRQYYPVPPNRTLLHQTPLLPQPPYPKPTPFP